MTLEVSRKSITSVLKKKLDDKEAVDFEKEIYKMCQRLLEEYDESIEDIYNKYAYEKTGDLMQAKGKEEREKIRQDIKGDVRDWDSTPFEGFRKKRDAENLLIVRGIETEKSDYKCKAKGCGSRNIIQQQIQTRSADEPASLFIRCLKCGRQDRID